MREESKSKLMMNKLKRDIERFKAKAKDLKERGAKLKSINF